MKNNIKKRKTLRRPIAIGMALVLVAAVVPKYTPVAYAATGYVIDETANSTDVSVIKGDIASQHSAIRVAAHGHTAYIKAGNVTAASEDPVSYGTSDYAIYADGIGKSGKVTLIVGDITAPKGQSIRGGAGDEGSELNITTGNIKSKDGMNVTVAGNAKSVLKTGDIESETANYLSNMIYYGADGGDVTADLGNVTVTNGSALNLTSAHNGGVMTVKAGKLTAHDAAALSLSCYQGGKLTVTTGDITSTGEDFRSNALYKSGGDGETDVTVDGNAKSQGTTISISDPGVYRFYGDVTSVAGDGIRADAGRGDINILITGTLDAATHGMNNGSGEKKYKFDLTAWKIKWGEKSRIVEGDDENETKAKAINYIVKTTQPAAGSFRVVKADGTSPLDTKTYKHSGKDEVFEVAHQGDRLYLKSDATIVKAYNGSGAEKKELPKDASGRYYYDVVKGGGIDISAELSGVTPAPTAAPTAAPTSSPTPTVSPKPTTKPTVKKANPMTVEPRRIYGRNNHVTVVKRDRAFTIKNAKGKLSFERVSASSHKLQIDKKTGDVTIGKKLKEDKNYYLTVNVKAAGNDKYKPKTIKVQLRIRIK